MAQNPTVNEERRIPDSEEQAPAAHHASRRRFWIPAAIIVIAAAAFILLLRFGGEILVHTDPLPPRADVAVVLDGDQAGLTARTAEAVRLLRRGTVDRILLSLPPKSYWGKSVPVEASEYFSRRYGKSIADKIAFCTSNSDSTIEEEGALQWCLQTAGWKKVIVVTSNYHTRRAGDIWRAALRRSKAPIQLWVDGASDGNFQPRGWWRSRRYTKTWLFEGSKLAWESVFGEGPWRQPPIATQFVDPAVSQKAEIRPGSPPSS